MEDIMLVKCQRVKKETKEVYFMFSEPCIVLRTYVRKTNKKHTVSLMV